MNIVAIIQARMGSTRLPGKVIKEIAGETMLSKVVHRTMKAKRINQIVVAMTINTADDVIVRECTKLKISFYRGSEEDVLDRFHQAAREYKADVIVRITSDCPLIDGALVDKVINVFLKEKSDYASNTLKPTYPRGLDCEVMTPKALEIAWKNARKVYERVHVTPYIYQHPNIFKLSSLEGNVDYSRYRLTVDTQEDLDLAREIYKRFNTDNFSWLEVIRLFKKEQTLPFINEHIRQKTLEEG